VDNTEAAEDRPESRILVRLPDGSYVDAHDAPMVAEFRLTWTDAQFKTYKPTGLFRIDYLVDGANGKERWRCIGTTCERREVEPGLMVFEPIYQGEPWKTALTARSWLELTESLYDKLYAIYGDAIKRRVHVSRDGNIDILDEDEPASD
jgi:hypothetical protein